MVNNILNFLDFNFISFNKTQCLKRIAIFWIVSTIVIMIDQFSFLWFVTLFAINLIVSILFIVLIIKFNNFKLSRFVCDGMFYLYLSVLFMLLSYKILTLSTNANYIILVILLTLLFACIASVILLTWRNIKKGAFSNTKFYKEICVGPVAGAVCGILVASVLFQNSSQQSALTILAIVILLLSFIISIPSVNLMKFFLLLYIDNGKTGDGSVS